MSSLLRRNGRLGYPISASAISPISPISASAAPISTAVINGSTAGVAAKALREATAVTQERFSILDLSIAKVVLGNMAPWSAEGVESGVLVGSCLWDAELVLWAKRVVWFFDRLYTRARFFLKANVGKLWWCDCLAEAWRAVGKVVHLVDGEGGFAVKEFRHIAAMRSAKQKVRAAASRVVERLYRELLPEPKPDFFTLCDGTRLKRYDM